MDIKTKLSDKLDNVIGNFAEGNMPDHAFLKVLRECVVDAERLEAPPPTLNIGMGEKKRFPMQNGPSIPWPLAEVIYAGYAAMYTGQSLERIAERHGFGWAEVEVFWNDRRGNSAMIAQMKLANAHTKAVTVDAIVKLAEEWDAYRVVTPADPDGIEDFRTRLLKLIQE